MKTIRVDMKKSETKDPAGDTSPGRWWTASDRDVGTRLTSAAEALEVFHWRDRFMWYTCARLMTGRGIPGSFGMSMSARSSRLAQSMWNAMYNPPSLNVVAVCGDVLGNKIYKERPFVEWIPNRGDYDARVAADQQTEFADAVADHTKAWPMFEQCGTDCMTYPASYLKVSEGNDDSISVSRVLHEEMLYHPDDMGMFGIPRALIQRVFGSREDLAVKCTKGKTKEEARTIIAALQRVDACYPGFYRGMIDYSDVVPLCEGWRLPFPDGRPGRHVLSVGSVVLLDEPWKRTRFPFSKLVYNPISNSYAGQSLAEVTMPLQKELDRVCSTIAECERRQGWPRWAYSNTSGINPDMFAGPGFIVHNPNQPPTPLESKGAPTDLYRQRDSLIQAAFQRNGISQNAASGQKPEGLSSGLALLTNNQIDDTRHVSPAQRFEDFITDTFGLIIDQGIETRPKVVFSGRETLDWDMVAKMLKRGRLKAFPISRLPTLPAARQQKIQNWYDEGSISKQQKARLEQMPDTNPTADALASSENFVAKSLDKIVKTKKFVPPSPYSDLKAALSTAQARWLTEATTGAPDHVLFLLSTYIEAVKEMMEADMAGAAAGAAPPMQAGPPMGGSGPGGLPPNVSPPGPQAQIAPAGPGASPQP